MLDIRLIRDKTDFVKAELAKVQCPALVVDDLLAADRRRREALQALETRRAERTRRSAGERQASALEKRSSASVPVSSSP